MKYAKIYNLLTFDELMKLPTLSSLEDLIMPDEYYAIVRGSAKDIRFLVDREREQFSEFRAIPYFGTIRAGGIVGIGLLQEKDDDQGIAPNDVILGDSIYSSSEYPIINILRAIKFLGKIPVITHGSLYDALILVDDKKLFHRRREDSNKELLRFYKALAPENEIVDALVREVFSYSPPVWELEGIVRKMIRLHLPVNFREIYEEEEKGRRPKNENFPLFKEFLGTIQNCASLIRGFEYRFQQEMETFKEAHPLFK